MAELSGDGFFPLFDGVSLAGWHPAPRIYGDVYPGGPSVLRWGVGAQCRWRNIRIKELPAGSGDDRA